MPNNNFSFSLHSYLTIIFDCDGVILDSNRIKTDAFRIAALPWGGDASDSLVEYHIENGGISRHQKFAHFLDTILPHHAPTADPGIDGPGLDELLESYAQAVRFGLTSCNIAEGLEELRSRTSQATWCIVSGGDQDELREIFAMRDLNNLFDGGIFGSPDNKDTILARELESGTIQKPALFFGDSRYDYEAAQRAGIDFVFVSGWTDVREWEAFTMNFNICTVETLRF